MVTIAVTATTSRCEPSPLRGYKLWRAECTIDWLLPRDKPLKTRSGSGEGERCAVCAVPISAQELQREVDFETGETLRLHEPLLRYLDRRTVALCQMAAPAPWCERPRHPDDRGAAPNGANNFRLDRNRPAPVVVVMR